ncbi:MAG TPA: 2-oxoglutarate dehydrogenase, E2 component, dihydrolipoamide succinyltransferase [Mycobacteriales bacterium]|nr:2-oxoglutarate dehydrogenase, E2 component, dihydrolipoamide succinyltransferase [Mycobacteriales bacterium]
MSVSVTMPRLGESVSEGTVTRWLKKEGDQVQADEPLLEVSTDKVDTEIPSPAAGVLAAIKVGEDETVEVGSELAVIEDGAGGGGSGGGTAQAAAPAAAAAPDQAAAERDAEPQAVGKATPAQPQPAQETTAPAPQRTPEQDGQASGESAAPPQQREQVASDGAAAPQGQQVAPAPQSQLPTQPAQPPAQPAEDGDEDGGGGPSYVTPLVRRLAAEHGVDLASVQGTGVGGRIRKQDVLDAASRGPAAGSGSRQQPTAPAAATPQAPAPAASAPAAPRPAAVQGGPEVSLRGRTEKLSRLRAVIAERMVESLQTSAQLTTVVEADITKIARLRERAKDEFEAREGVRLSYLPFFALATCEALREHPAVNASIDVHAGTATYHDAVHLGIAVDTPRGLLVPVIKDASDLNLAGLARKIADLAERTRGNHITPDELGGGTFTLTNTGSRGALFDTPIINQPQVGILGTGAVVKRPVVVDDPDVGEVIAVRHMVYLALTYDHRMVDGADAARFLTTIKARLEDGEFEL